MTDTEKREIRMACVKNAINLKQLSNIREEYKGKSILDIAKGLEEYICLEDIKVNHEDENPLIKVFKIATLGVPFQPEPVVEKCDHYYQQKASQQPKEHKFKKGDIVESENGIRIYVLEIDKDSFKGVVIDTPGYSILAPVGKHVIGFFEDFEKVQD